MCVTVGSYGSTSAAVLALILQLSLSHAGPTSGQGESRRPALVEPTVTVDEVGLTWLDDRGAFTWDASVRNRSMFHVDVDVHFDVVDYDGGVIASDSVTVRMAPGSTRDVGRVSGGSVSANTASAALGGRAWVEWRLAGIVASSDVLIELPAGDPDRTQVGLLLDLDAQAVVITNYGPTEVMLSGWTLVDATSGNRLVFGQAELPPGASITISSGDAAPDDSPNPIRWLRANRWKQGDSVKLLSARGLLVAQAR